MNGFAVLCQLACLNRPRIRFLFVGSWMSHSLPPHGRLFGRSWLLLVLLVTLIFIISAFISHTGT